MAIDTRAKRASVQAYPWEQASYPNPTGTVDTDDREHVAGFYVGFDYAGALPEPPSGTVQAVYWRERRLR